MRKFQEIVANKDALFLPLIFEAYGVFYPALKQLIIQTARKSFSYHSIPEDKIAKYWLVHLSCMLQRVFKKIILNYRKT